MNIQIDIDGTIDEAPGFFRWLTASLKRDGHKVIIVTSRTDSPETRTLTTKELKDWGITYDKLILSPETDKLDPKRLPKDLDWAHKLFIFKVITAQDDDVDILFDDCSITASLFKRYLPQVKIFRFLK
ncbi:MAG: hypothetical protein AABZ44_00420 [Elusimicrobiota bacterium]